MFVQIYAEDVKRHRNKHNESLIDIWFYDRKGGTVIVSMTRYLANILKEVIENEINCV